MDSVEVIPDTYWIWQCPECLEVNRVYKDPFKVIFVLCDDCEKVFRAKKVDDEKPDLSTCPKCGGPADNGHDREFPPNPYFCTKCENL